MSPSVSATTMVAATVEFSATLRTEATEIVGGLLDLDGSRGNASEPSATPSPSSSVSALLPIPSLSVSNISEGSSGNASEPSATPSPSSSVSALLPIPSLSVSNISEGSSGNASEPSATPSPSSSVSALLPIPSLSVSEVSSGSSGNASRVSLTPSPSVSASGSPKVIVRVSSQPCRSGESLTKNIGLGCGSAIRATVALPDSVKAESASRYSMVVLSLSAKLPDITATAS